MTTLNAAATLEQATDFANDYAGATLTILNGATPLVSHVVTSFTPSNSGADAIATGNLANGGAETITGTGTQTATTAKLTSATGGREITLTVGTSGANVNINPLSFINGETSTITSFVVDFPSV